MGAHLTYSTLPNVTYQGPALLGENYVAGPLPGDPLRFGVVLREDVVPYVPEQVHSPGWGHPLCPHDVVLTGGMVRPGFW